MKVFEELGELIERRWKDRNYDDAAFPEIAESALVELNPVERVAPMDIVRHLHSALTIPAQHGEEFSDLPITLYTGPRFYVDVYFWLDGTTAIHQHSFSGAFQVLSGSSIHSLYSFTREHEVNSRFSAGKILLEDVQVLERGDIRRILPGDKFIHSLFHLDRPSATITVRTVVSPSDLPQYVYLKPYLASDPFFKEQLAMKKLSSVTMLLRLNHPEAYPLIGELISASDLQSTFLILTAVFETLVNRAREKNFSAARDGQEPDGGGDSAEWDAFRELFRKAHERHGSLVNLLTPVLGEMQRQASIVELRRSVTEREHRFFLALLLNVPHRTRILDLVRRRVPDRNPVDTVCEWVTQFSDMRNPMSPARNILGIDDFSEAHMFVLRRLLEGGSPEELRGSLGDERSAEGAPAAGEVEALHQSLKSSVLIKSLLPN